MIEGGALGKVPIGRIEIGAHFAVRTEVGGIMEMEMWTTT